MTNEDEIFSSRARELRDEGDRALQQQQLRNALTAYERVRFGPCLSLAFLRRGADSLCGGGANSFRRA
jgi:hypothetical protein